MVIVIARWYIKGGQDEKFKIKWQGMEPKSKEGLFREFFSKAIISSEEKYHTLDIESQHSSGFVQLGWTEVPPQLLWVTHQLSTNRHKINTIKWQGEHRTPYDWTK